MIEQASPVLLAVAHGTDSVAGRRLIGAFVAAVKREAAGRVIGGYVDVQPPHPPRILAALEPGAPTVVVPLLLSTGYHVRVDLARAARDAAGPITVTGALGPDDALVRLLLRRLGEAGATDRDTVVLAAAGSSDAGAVRDCLDMAERLSAALGRAVRIGFLSAAEPRLPEAVDAARQEAEGARVIVATYLLAPGYFLDRVQQAGADAVSEPLLAPGLPVPDELVEVVLARYASGCADLHGAAVQASAAETS